MNIVPGNDQGKIELKAKADHVIDPSDINNCLDHTVAQLSRD